MQRVVQLQHPTHGRKVALVSEDKLCLLAQRESVYDFAEMALAAGKTLSETLAAARTPQWLDYDPVYQGQSDWRILPAFDYPAEPARCLVTGTGLTHKASAESRQQMHATQSQPLTDSMRMYQSGLEGGRPATGKIGAQPEWFYKGCGTILRAHGEPLLVPPFGLDGGEEAEVAGVYIIDVAGEPRRVGMALGNEFSDHKLEAGNYLWLAHSKLRNCALGPELIIGGDFNDCHGHVSIERGQKTIWTKAFATGEKNMSHSLVNLEHHHFKYSAHRRPGDAHIHFLGADVFSFSDGIELADGDIMAISLTGFGRPLRNPLRVDRAAPAFVSVRSL